MTTSSDQGEDIRGFTEPGFEGLRDAFAAAQRARHARRRRALGVPATGSSSPSSSTGTGAGSAPRTPETTQVVFSCTKGVVATALLMLIERGQLELDAPMAQYWPEFGEHGKGDLLVRHVVSHMSGQPSFRAPGQRRRARGRRVRRVGGRERRAVVGAGHADRVPVDLLRRALRRPDPAHRRRLDRARSCSARSRSRSASTSGSACPRSASRTSRRCSTSRSRSRAIATDNPASIAQVENPRVLHTPDAEMWNTRAYHAAEIPGAGGIATATSLARLYACLANGGTLDGHAAAAARDRRARAHDDLGGPRGVQRRSDALRGRLHARDGDRGGVRPGRVRALGLRRAGVRRVARAQRVVHATSRPRCARGTSPTRASRSCSRRSTRALG